MRTLLPHRLALIALALSLITGLAHAQQKLEKLPEPPPPPPGYTPDSAQEPEVTIRNRNGAQYEEYRVNGKLYRIKVTPQIGPVYYLIPADSRGGWSRVSDLDRSEAIPQWVLLSW